MKECTKCKVIKPLSDYSFQKSTKDGYQYACKICHSRYMKKKRLETKPKQRICIDCGTKTSIHGNTKRCKSCSDKAKKISVKKYYQTIKDGEAYKQRQKEYAKKYRDRDRAKELIEQKKNKEKLLNDYNDRLRDIFKGLK